MMEDKKGQELLRMQAEKDLHKLVKHDEDVKIGRDRTKNIGRDDVHNVGQDRTRSVGRNESISIGKDLVKQVAGNEREMTGLSRNIVVGVNRAAQIGQIDSTIVGNTHTVIVMPPGEGIVVDGGGGGGGPSTSITTQNDKITIGTASGAQIILDGAKITLKAPQGILIEAAAGDVTIKGTPKIKLNP